MTQLELTVVVGVYKRPDIFSTLVDSIIFSTARVRRLWIVCNGSPYLELFRAKVHELAESLRADAQGGGRAIEVAFFGTEKEVGYYERFLRALVVDTQYLAFIDDDMVIGRRVLEVCLHALNTRKFYGLIGIRGPLLPDRGVVDGQRRITDSKRDCRYERAHFQNAPSALTDFLYNFWVGETEMFRYMFRSSPLTLKTGEDMMLSFAVQHHAKLRCLSLDVCELEPDDELFLDFCGDCQPSLKIENRSWTDVGTAEEGAAGGRAVPALALEGYASDDAHREHTGLRQRVLERLWRRGWPLVFTREWASRAQAPELLVVADEQQARVAVADKLLRSLDATWLLLGHGHFVHAPRTDAAAAAAAASIASILGVEHEFVAGDLRIFELDAGQWQPHTESFPGRFAHVLTSVQSVIEAARPTRVVVIDDGSIESSAAATSAALLGIPVTCVCCPPAVHVQNPHRPSPSAQLPALQSLLQLPCLYQHSSLALCLSWQQGCLTSRHSLIPSRAQASRSNMSTLGACGQMWRQISCALCHDKTLSSRLNKSSSLTRRRSAAHRRRSELRRLRRSWYR
jgi:hypothetical protein